MVMYKRTTDENCLFLGKLQKSPVDSHEDCRTGVIVFNATAHLWVIRESLSSQMSTDLIDDSEIHIQNDYIMTEITFTCETQASQPMSAMPDLKSEPIFANVFE